MKRLLLSILLFALFMASPVCGAQGLSFGRFGDLALYGKDSDIKSVALFVSGDGGWNQGVVDMAQSLAAMNALVVGIDIRHYLKEITEAQEKCSYPAADFEALSKYVQKQLGIEKYIEPVLVGYSSGATLVYATLAQAPPGTFLGAISMGFCPDLPVHRPFCSGYGLKSEPRSDETGYDFLPTASLKVPWIAFQGDIDQVCNATAVQAFTKSVPNSTLVQLQKVGHGFSVQKNWLPQFREQYRKLTAASDADPQLPPKPAPEKQPENDAALGNLDDLPLVELPGAKDNPTFAVIVTGDGGWAAIDRSLGESLASHGISVVGFNSLKYFWNVKTPEQSSQDLQRIVEYYLTAWQKEKVLLIGYSQGADVLPFMVSRLPQPVQDKILGIALLGLAQEASFEISVSNWLGSAGSAPIKIEPEIEKLTNFKVLCIYGSEEDDTLCREANKPIPEWHSIEMPGGHHFGNDFKTLANRINTAFRLNEEK